MIENVVLACLLNDAEASEYLDQLTVDDFTTEDNREIIKIMKDLKNQNQSIDYITVSNKMPWSELRIKTLPIYEPTYMLSSIDTYIAQLKEESTKRKFVKALKEAERATVLSDESIDVVISDTIKSFTNLNSISEGKLIDLGDINSDAYVDTVRIKSELQNFDKMIGGFRLGELSVWTGKSGQGKSTLLSQLILSTINQGYKVCAYSGELINEQFQHWLILQACGIDHLIKKYDPLKMCDVYIPEENAKRQIRKWFKQKIYLYNNEFTGQDNNILNVFKIANKKYGCKVFLVDNLMTAKYDYNAKESYYIQQSGFVGELVRFAKTNNVHVHLIAHPKKTQGDVSKEDISGTMDITNRADNVFSVNRDEETNSTLVSILKNRSEGIQNKQVALDFDVRTKRFSVKGNEMSKYKKYNWEHEVDKECKPF